MKGKLLLPCLLSAVALLASGRALFAEDLPIKPLAGRRATNAILAHLTMQSVGSLPVGVSAPASDACEVEGTPPYTKNALANLAADCDRATYARSCAVAAREHRKECVDFCKEFKKLVSQQVCVGSSHPTAPLFAPGLHCKAVGGTDKFDVECTVTGPCVCDP